MRSTAVYPGSFDPPTLGHVDVIERASRLFDHVVVAVGINSGKMPLLSVEARCEAIRESVAHLPTVRVEGFSGLLIDYVRSKDAHAIVRGLRATADFEYEFQMAMVNRRLSEDIETVFFMTKWEYSYLSSSIVKEVANLGGDYLGMVPDPAARAIALELSKRKG